MCVEYKRIFSVIQIILVGTCSLFLEMMEQENITVTYWCHFQRTYMYKHRSTFISSKIQPSTNI